MKALKVLFSEEVVLNFCKQTMTNGILMAIIQVK